MNEHAARPPEVAADETVPEVELSDEDILDAMRHIPGYLDISTGDFREIYHLAHRHATERLLSGLRADGLMRPVPTPLAPGMMLDEAARTLVASGFKALPVVDAGGRVVGHAHRDGLPPPAAGGHLPGAAPAHDRRLVRGEPPLPRDARARGHDGARRSRCGRRRGSAR